MRWILPVLVVLVFAWWWSQREEAFARDVTVTVTMPATNEDGSALTDLSGWTLHWGNVQGGPYPASQQYLGAMPGETVMEVGPDLGDGTWYFVATAFDTSGNNSPPSNEAVLIVDETAPNPPSIDQVL